MGRVTGGKKLARFIRAQKRGAERDYRITVGFVDRRIAPLAAQLEFGNPRTKLPARPAFRNALVDIRKDVRKVAAAELRRNRGTLDDKGAERIAIAGRDALQRSYFEFEGPGLSERQEARKRGTRGAGKELIGSRGPKLIGHIRALVNDVDVD